MNGHYLLNHEGKGPSVLSKKEPSVASWEMVIPDMLWNDSVSHQGNGRKEVTVIQSHHVKVYSISLSFIEEKGSY